MNKMDEILQKMLGVKIEYGLGQEEMKINLGEAEENIYAKLDTISINPKIVSINNLEVKKNSIKMDVKAPIICNPRSVQISSTMMAGIKFEGEGKKLFVDKIEERVRSFGPEWEEAVSKRKEEIVKRNNLSR